MDLLSNIALGFDVALSVQNLSLLLRRRAARHAGRRTAGHRPGHHRRDAAADLVHARTGLRHDHAGGHLLRRAIRRLDHGDPGQHSGRSLVRRHHASTATRWRGRAAPVPRSASRPSDRSSPAAIATLLITVAAPPLAAIALAVRAGGIFLAHGLRPDRRRRAGARLGGQGHRHGGAGAAARARRHRHQFRHPPLRLRLPGARRRHRIRGAVDGDLRHRRGRLQSRTEAGHRRRHQAPSAASGRAGPISGSACPRFCAAPCSARCSACCRAAARCWRPSAPIRWRRRSPSRRAISATATSAASRRRNRPTMPARRPRSFPMLTLGIPSNPTMAMMIGALMIHGISPGPRVMTDQPELFWGVVASMWIGNLMLVVLNLPLVGIWVRFLRIPYRLLFPVDHRVLLHRHLHDQQQRLRRVRDGVLCRVWLPLPQARLRAGAAHPRLRARADDGGESAPRAADLARRSQRVRERTDQPRIPAGLRRLLLLVVAAPSIRSKREEALQE